MCHAIACQGVGPASRAGGGVLPRLGRFGPRGLLFTRPNPGYESSMETGNDGPAAKPDAEKSRNLSLLAAFEATLLFSRWLQIPLLVGLIVALVLIQFKFAQHLFVIMADLQSVGRERVILVTLDLIDMVLIANLVVMIVISGYETFVSNLHMEDEPSVPRWMRRSTTGKLKLRIATTILLISTIHMLHVYLDPARVDPSEITFMLIAQGIFVLTAAAYVFFNWLEYGPGNRGDL